MFSTAFTELVGGGKETKRTSSSKIDDSVKMVIGAPLEDLKDQLRGKLSKRKCMWSLRVNTNVDST